MIKIFIFTNGYKHYSTVIQDLQKRIPKLEIIQISPTNKGNIEKNIQLDTQKIIEKLQKFPNYTKIFLDKSGQQLDTLQLKNFFDKNVDLIFIIGGPYGLDLDKIKDKVDKIISFGNITISHLVILIILLEQIFRIQSLQNGKKYHY